MAQIPDNPSFFRRPITTVSGVQPGMQVSPQTMANPAITFASTVSQVADNAEKFLLIKAEEIRKRKINEANLSITSDLTTLSNDLQAMRTNDEVSFSLFGKPYTDTTDDEKSAMGEAMQTYQPENWVVSIEQKKNELIKNYFINNNIKSKSLQSSIVATVNADFFKIKNSLEIEANNRIEKLHTLTEFQTLMNLSDKRASANSIEELNVIDEQAKSSLNFLQLKLGVKEYYNAEREYFKNSATSVLENMAAGMTVTDFVLTDLDKYEDPLFQQIFSNLTQDEKSDIFEDIKKRKIQEYDLITKVENQEIEKAKRQEQKLFNQIIFEGDNEIQQKLLDEYKNLPLYALKLDNVQKLESMVLNPDNIFRTESDAKTVANLNILALKNELTLDELMDNMNSLNQTDFKSLASTIISSADKSISLLRKGILNKFGIYSELILDSDNPIHNIIGSQAAQAEYEISEFQRINPDANATQIQNKKDELLNTAERNIKDQIMIEMKIPINNKPSVADKFRGIDTPKGIFDKLNELSNSENPQDRLDANNILLGLRSYISLIGIFEK